MLDVMQYTIVRACRVVGWAVGALSKDTRWDELKLPAGARVRDAKTTEEAQQGNF